MGANATPPEATVESLQAELEAEQSAHQVTKDSLEAEQTAHQSTKEALETEQAAHESTKADAVTATQEATEFINGQAQTIADQEAQIIALQTSPAEFPIITVGKEKYEVQAKTFKYQGQQYTVAQLLAQPALQKELVKKGMGFLVLVKKEA